MANTYQKNIDPNSIDKETTKAFKKVKFDIEELRRLLNSKQDKQTNVLIEMNNMRSELKIEFREELLELQRTMTQEMDALRKEILFYRELYEQHKEEHHKIRVIERSVQKEVVEEPKEEDSFTYQRIEREEPKSQANEYYKSTQQVQEFDYSNNSTFKKTYLKWITVGDSDLDSIDEVQVK